MIAFRIPDGLTSEMSFRALLLPCVLHLPKDDREENEDYLCLKKGD